MYETKTLGKKSTKLSITLHSISKGSLNDLDGYKLPAQVKKSDLFYVTMKFQNIGPLAMEPGGIFGLINAYNSDGDELETLSLFGSFAKCEGDTPHSLRAGSSYSDCRVYMAPKGQTLATIKFGHYDANYNRTEIKWKAASS
ncbi:hypothetical protein ABT272_44840 [Streptomyces sp900105245]|uniref:Uncharacterized protein n=1 Tax=Streptomyces sp. 900105245 TaxID=3154379 RepID=A0ABV1ULJ7_9ACTN